MQTLHGVEFSQDFHEKGKMSAFTLAEILITLTILGVIASITIPSLIQNTQKREFEAGAKKAMSVLNGAIGKAEIQLGHRIRCGYYTGGCKPHSCDEKKQNADGSWYCSKYSYPDGNGGRIEGLPANVCGSDTDCNATTMKALLDNLSIIKTCRSGYADGCLPLYEGNDTIQMANGTSASDAEKNTVGSAGFRKNSIKTKNAYVLADGMVIFPFSNNWPKIIAVDVNGKKPPNKWGYDVFEFALQTDDGESPQYFPRCSMVEKGGKCTRKVIMGQ